MPIIRRSKMCALCGECCLHTVHTSCHPTLQHHNSYNRTDNYRQWNAVGSPDDGHKDAWNMLRYYWLPINHYLLHLVGFSFTYLSKMHGHSNIKFARLLVCHFSEGYSQYFEEVKEIIETGYCHASEPFCTWGLQSCRTLSAESHIHVNTKLLHGYTVHQYMYIEGVPGGMDKTSGECSLCWTIPI